MKLFRMFLVSLALSLIFAGAALAKADVTELYAEALMTGDVESLDKLLAPNYWHVSANGHIQDKEHFLASSRKGSWSSTVSASATCAAPSWVM